MNPVGTERTPLWDALRAPSVPAPTSEAAALAVEASGTVARQAAAILAYLRTRPDGATAAEIEAALGLSGNAVRPRLLELGPGIGGQLGAGVLRRTTETRVVPGHRAACVWRVVSRLDNPRIAEHLRQTDGAA